MWTKIKNKGTLHSAKLNIIISRMRGGSGCAVEELGHWKDKCSWLSWFVVVTVYKVIENTNLMNIEQHLGLKGNTQLGSWETGQPINTQLFLLMADSAIAHA